MTLHTYSKYLKHHSHEYVQHKERTWVIKMKGKLLDAPKNSHIGKITIY